MFLLALYSQHTKEKRENREADLIAVENVCTGKWSKGKKREQQHTECVCVCVKKLNGTKMSRGTKLRITISNMKIH